MPHRRDHWSFRGSGSCWLLKLADQRVHAGIIQKYSDTSVHLRAEGEASDRRIPSDEIQWIRPLVSMQVDGWTIMLGFHPDESDFETWWVKGDLIQRLCYSDPVGFSPAEEAACACADLPSAQTRARGHVLVHEALQRQRLETAASHTPQQ